MSRTTTKGAFVPQRLVEAREARVLTQTAVAARLGRGASTVTNWERGAQAPEPMTLELLANALGVEAKYFLMPMPNYGTSAIFFRSLANATARLRAREKARLRWLQHTSIVLQEVLDLPPMDIPAAVRPGAFRDLRSEDVECVAADLRCHWRLGEGPIRTMLLVVENAGAVVGVDDIGTHKIDAQATWCEADGRPYMLLARDKQTAFRRQMDLAHELGHLVLHRGVTEEEHREYFELIEEQAWHFAGAFLMPSSQFSAEIYSLSLDGFLAMKPRWMVSVGAMIMRARHLELLSAEAARQMWKYRAIRGWHKREPLDLPTETQIEGPRVLRRSIEMLVNDGVRAKRDLLRADIALGAMDVEMLCDLPVGYFAEGDSVVRLEPRLRSTGEARDEAVVVPFRRHAH